ncbi:MAG: 1-(5-phosphoribosyl)-5-[(5-phosphoribosylamino)methylideneamino]imidazole-4-carboxamide isomerase [Clostridia bacterium]|nr:1-(5-phosphoribosyl)-5-[(5-phosphoribosylamino)methylideneamino]imidazole-4-carboxamide isomerase [Clostridia bacterium]
MIIYPAVDVKDGRCVRLSQGKFNDVTVYAENPVEMALKWEQMGAQYLHVIDLDGARCGEPKNLSIISEMAVKLGIPVQLGGGIRTIDNIELVLCKGVERVILGTSAVKNPELVRNALKTFGEKIVIGIDAKDGRVAIEGWEKTSDFTAVEFAKKMEYLGAKTIIYTDIAKDGMLQGPNLAAMEEMVKAVGADIICAGGVSKTEDVINLKNAGVAGAIIGKAIYTGDIDLVEAIRAAK